MTASIAGGPARVVAATQAVGVAVGGGDVSLGSAKFKDGEFALELTLEAKGDHAASERVYRQGITTAEWIPALKGRANLNANFTFAAKQEDLIFPPPFFLAAHTPLDGNGVVNLAASFEVVPGITLLMKGVNVFDEHYEEALGFKTQGASVYAGVSAAF